MTLETLIELENTENLPREEKVEFIRKVRGIYHSAFKQAAMELYNYNTSETIEFEFNSIFKMDKYLILSKIQNNLITQQQT